MQGDELGEALGFQGARVSDRVDAFDHAQAMERVLERPDAQEHWREVRHPRQRLYPPAGRC